jgi:hypothetical protein
MHLMLPDDVRLQVLIAPVGATPLLESERPAARAQRASRHPLLKGTAVVALMGLAFLLGQHTHLVFRPTPAAQAEAAPQQPPPATNLPQQVPPNFERQLQQAPTVTPPPGQPSPDAASGKNPFGMEN